MVERVGDTMQARTVQILQALPPDLVERGWHLLVSESEVLSWEIPHHKAVYVRPVEGN